MTSVDFRSTKMSNANFSSTIFCKSRLIMVKAQNAFFDECIFNDAMLLHSDFYGSSFRKADFSGCIVNHVVFKNCDLRGANLGCPGLETCDFEGVICDALTVWKENFNVMDCGGIKII